MIYWSWKVVSGAGLLLFLEFGDFLCGRVGAQHDEWDGLFYIESA